MTVRTRRLGRVLIGLVIVCFVAGGLSVEALTHAGVSRAERALPGALARAVLPDPAGGAAAEHLAAARRHARQHDPRGAAQELEAVVAETPTPELHATLAYAWLAADQGVLAARHAQLAARLAPDDARLATLADRTVDVAVAYRLRPYSRPAGGLAGLLLLVALTATAAHRRRTRLRRRFLASVRARVHAWADGEQLGHPLAVPAGTERLTLDVFLSGRHGMGCPRRPLEAPTLHLAFSSPGSNQTVRLRPVKDVTESAVRVPVTDETLRRLLARPGAWRLHIRLDDRPILAVPVTVGQPAARAGRRHRLFARAW